MAINNLQYYIASPLYKAALDGFRKISTCANALFSVIKEEGFAWKSFLSNNSYIYKMYSVGSDVTASIAKKSFILSNQQTPPTIDDSNPSMEAFHSSNKAWIQNHSLLCKSYPNLQLSDETLLDVIFSKGTDSKGVIQFAKNFFAANGNDDLTPALLDWEKAYERQQVLQNRSQEIRNTSSQLAEEQGRVLLLLEKEPTYSDSPLSECIKKLLEKCKPEHDRLYQNFYRKVKEKLQTYLNTNWKKRCFTEMQEEIRAILLEQYSELHQMGTLKHNIPTFLQPLLSNGEELSSSEENKSLAGVVWDLFLQNGLNEGIDQPISVEKLNQIFEKEFTMITHALEKLTLTGINQLIKNVGEEKQLLLQLCGSRLPQKNQGWLEITPECDTYCQVNLCVRDMSHPRTNMMISGKATAIKKYSYTKVPKNLLQTNFFVDLLTGLEGDESIIASEEKIKKFFSRLGKPVESYVRSGDSVFFQTGILDQIKAYYCDREGSSLESLKTPFFQMRLHAFVAYCSSVQKNPVVSEATVSTLQNSIESLQAEAGLLHETKQISDKEYIETIATTLEVEEYIIKRQKKVQAGQEESSGNMIPPIIKEQLQNLFSTIPISELDIENIKSFATVLLGKDMSGEIALLCRELPIASKKVYSYSPPHISFLQFLKILRIDLGNLRASPIGLFTLYSDVNQLLRQFRILIACISCIPYLSMLALYTNPIVALAVVTTTAALLGTMHALPYGKVMLNFCQAVSDFHEEAFNFLLMRILVRLLQLSDIALHWNESNPIQKAKFFLTENISGKISFSLQAPLPPISPSTLEELDPENIPREISPLQRFYPHMRVIPDRQNLHNIRQIVFPKLSMGFRIEENNGAMRARLHGQSEFWLAESITDTKLENADFSHLLLENNRGDKKICIVPKPTNRLFLQTLLRMCNAYSRKSIDLLSDFLSDKLPEFLQEGLSEVQPRVHYCDWVDGEIVSQDCDAIGYFIAHYIASGDAIQSQKLVDQLKTMKADGEIENPDTMLRMLEQINFIAPRLLSPDIIKIILQLCALCDEIPLQSKAFPFFLRAYQSYVDSKEANHVAYLSEEEESLLLHHLQDESGEIPQTVKQVILATSTVGFQTLSLLLSTIVDGVYNASPFGKAGYIPASLKKYELQQQYASQDGDVISLLLGLAMNNLINPYFAFGKTAINTLRTFYKAGKDEGDLFDLFPNVLSKLNTESSTTRSDQFLLLFPLIVALLRANRDKDVRSVTLQAILSAAQDMSSLAIATNNGFCVEERFDGLMQSMIGLLLDTRSLDEYGIQQTYPSLSTRHLVRAGVRTVENLVETQGAYTKQKELEDSYWFPLQALPSEYVNLQTLEQSILKRYRDISDTFLRKQDSASDNAPELNFPRQSSMEDQLTYIVDWYESGRARESDQASYFLEATQSSGDLVQELQQVHTELTAMCKNQRETIQDLLTYPAQDLSLLNHQIERYTEEIRDNFVAAEELQQRIRENYQNQSTLKKVGLGFLQYINSLVEVPTFGLLQLPENPETDTVRKKRSELLKEVESIEVRKEQLFQNMITAFKPRTSLGFNEVYSYFCQGKDASIIKSLSVSENQWKVIKEQLYRYMILQKYLSHAEHIKELSISRDRTIDENMDLIGHQLDHMAPSIEELPTRDIFLRSQMQLEKKLGRSLSPAIRNQISDIVGHSIKNYQAFYQQALSA